MTQGFDDWQWNYGDSLQSSEVPKVKKAYLAGAASRQAEVDALQKRIDNALNFYNIAKSDANIGMMQMAIYLKGEQK